MSHLGWRHTSISMVSQLDLKTKPVDTTAAVDLAARELGRSDHASYDYHRTWVFKSDDHYRGTRSTVWISSYSLWYYNKAEIKAIDPYYRDVDKSVPTFCSTLVLLPQALAIVMIAKTDKIGWIAPSIILNKDGIVQEVSKWIYIVCHWEDFSNIWPF
jgi:hypothetical protein